MSDVAGMIFDALQSWLTEECGTDRLRGIEKQGDTAEIDALWHSIDALGFADLCLPEEHRGAGLTLAGLSEIVFLFGYHLLPLPLADTIIARLFLNQANQEIPDGMIVLGGTLNPRSGQSVSDLIVSSLFADRVSTALVQVDDNWLLIDLTKQLVSKKAGERGSLASFSLKEAKLIEMKAGLPPLNAVCASLRAAEMAGMIFKILELSVVYANDRNQFGKPIGQFQAIQQQLAVMAEESAAARMASNLAFNSDQFTVLASATAKMRAGTAATKVTAIAHAVHGAIGVSEEYDLQLYSRRLLELRLMAGSESFWAEEIGRQRLESRVSTSLDFVRQNF